MIKITLDLSELMGLEDLVENAQREMDTAGKQLAQLAHGHMLDLAQQRLRSRRSIFVENLKIQQEDDVWVVQLDAKARWVDDGFSRREMLDDLLKNGTTGADGVSKIKTIPFQHNTKPGDQTPAQGNLTDTIKREISGINAQRRDAGANPIEFSRIEKNADGSARLGLIHKIDINDKPLKTHSGPGQGSGPAGDVVQGKSGTPLLQGIRIYQQEVQNPVTGRKKIEKTIMTFRVASSKQRDGSSWIHPGVERAGIFEDTEEWLKDEFERMAPDLLKKITDSI